MKVVKTKISHTCEKTNKTYPKGTIALCEYSYRTRKYFYGEAALKRLKELKKELVACLVEQDFKNKEQVK